ncbi:ABC transporter ATP-binding protein [Azorhizobium doebereinerae]|uniref:ABC transporter ATP-binding protein n=1 Tax=Azorhizobium doebereinerae TaxID=281091 RepID=UPI0003F5F06B|nr:ABC transporter ATP-binding protein [Azorhizobium doebereinerae]
MTGTPLALDIRRLDHSFGKRRVLAGIDLAVEQGRFAALLGPNGAGKTTLFSIATRLYANRSGAVKILGHDLSARPRHALAELGVVFQARTLDLDLSVRQNLIYHAALHGLAGRAVAARIAHLLARVGLGERQDEPVRVLSGGQARRVEIARALVHRPRLLLLDEPTVGLDLAARTAIRAIVRDLVADEQVAVLWATHLFDEVAPGDPVHVLHHGRMIAEGTAAAIAAPFGGDLEQAFRALTETGAEEVA